MTFNRTVRRGLPALHPWFGQRGRTLLRSRPSARGVAALTVVLAIAVVLPLTLGTSPAGAAASLLRVLATWPGASAAVIALAVATIASRRLWLLKAELDAGWFAALPIPPARIRASLLVVATGYSLAGLVVWSAIAVMAASNVRGLVTGSLMPCAAGLFIGAGIGLWRALRPARRNSMPHPGRREPLFTTALDGSAPLAGVSQWQRRAVVLRWRQGQGGHFWLIGAMLVVLPDRMGLTLAAGALLMVAPWLWASLALQVCLATAIDAVALVQAAPVRVRGVLRSAMRYPTVALACATALAALGNLLLGFSWMRMLYWLLALGVVCVPAAARLRDAIRSAHR